MKQPNETQLPPEKETERRHAALRTETTFKLVAQLQRYDKAFPSAFGPRRRQLDCYMDEIETELLRRAGVVLEDGQH